MLSCVPGVAANRSSSRAQSPELKIRSQERSQRTNINMDAAKKAEVLATIKHPVLMNEPWFMLAVLGVYLYFIKVEGPRFMLFRKPFELKRPILVHNVIQVVSCLYVIREIYFVTNHRIFKFWECRELGPTPEHVRRHYNLAYFLFWLKTSELVETVIFVLRKKQNQVTSLHVFHHLTTLTLVYMLIHLTQNESSALFIVMLNSIVHVIMYSYYFVAAVADKSIVKALLPVKKSITITQMAQFSLMLIQVPVQVVHCGVPRSVVVYFVFVIIGVFYGFYDFYTTAYKNTNLQKQQKTP